MLYVAGLLLATAVGMSQPDRVFGFQMFNESSTIEISLERRVRRGGKRSVEPLPDGSWSARDRNGTVHRFRWTDRVHYGALGTLGVRRHASYGLDAQLFRLKRALEDVLRNIPDDAETEALIAVVEASRNGRPPERIRLTAVRR
ncbi:MAG TPA: hypothetical protein VGK73_13225 [Polyangiaceae bacterium]